MEFSTAGKLWHLMSRAQRRSAIGLVGFMLVGSVLETLGVGLVVPVLVVMSQSNPVERFPQLAAVLGPFANSSQSELLTAVMVVLVVTYAVKAAYLVYVTWRQARFVFALQVSLSRRLFEEYLHQPYTFHLQRNSAQLMRNVVTETSQFSHVATIPGLTLLSDGLVLLGIGALLLAIEPLGALIVMATIGSAGFAYHRLTQARVLRWGEARQLHEGMRIQHLQQGLGGAKEVKLLGRELQFVEQYTVHDIGVARVQERQLTLQALPRIWLELLGVTGLAALVLTMLSQGRPIEALVPTLGMFAAAAFRLMPSMSKVLASIQSLRYAQPVIDTLKSELSQLNRERVAQPVSSFTFHKTLQIEGLSYSYPESNGMALRDIALEIRHGTSVGIVGGSGAGKSTLIDVVLGLLIPSSGAVRVDGRDIHSNLRGWQNEIGYVPQVIYLTDDTLRSNVAFGLAPHQIDEAAVWRALRAAQLEEFVSQLPAGADTIVGERGVRLSGGQRQRIGIARALYHDPAVLVLDEATSALDTETERGVMEAVRALQGEKTILIIAHRTSTVEHCDVIVRLAQGSIVAVGDPEMMLPSMSTASADTATNSVRSS